MKISKNHDIILALRYGVGFKEYSGSYMLFPEMVSAYAIDYIKDRWLEYEHIILTNTHASLRYSSVFMKGVGWPEFEHMLLNSTQYKKCEIIAMYVIDIRKQRWPSIEPYLLKNATTKVLVDYAINVLRRRWKEAENRIISESFMTEWLYRYKPFFTDLVTNKFYTFSKK